MPEEGKEVKKSGEALTLNIAGCIEYRESVHDRVRRKSRWDLASSWVWSVN